MMITWITLKQPATRRDAVGDVYDLIWLDSVKIPKERIAENGCVEFGHAVHFVGSHKTQIGHANSLIDIVREDGRVRHDFEQIRVVLESILIRTSITLQLKIIQHLVMYMQLLKDV